MKTTSTIIGSRTHVDFPTIQVDHVPAKIDTGADSSSIWATDVHEEDGILAFVLFGPNSPFYTGKIISVKKYQVVSVKNSFGKSELRYKVSIPCVIEERKIRVQFTLANRANNTHPILIGRRTLAGKFLVDVTKIVPRDQPARVLILSQHISKNTEALVSSTEVALGNAIVDYATYDDVTVAFRGGQMSVNIDKTGFDLSQYEVVHFKTSITRDLTASLAQYAEAQGVKVVDANAIKHFPTTSKIYEYTLLSLEGVLVPDTIVVTPKRLMRSYDTFVQRLGSPFILKDIHGSKGNYNELIHNEREFDVFAKKALDDEVYLVGQSFVENDGDYRILVFAKKIVLVIYRYRKDEATHLNNTSQGAAAELRDEMDLPEGVRFDSIRAADTMGRDIAGVDMVYDKSKKMWYCFEVNDGPQLATGAFLEQKKEIFAQYIKRELEKR